MTLLHATDIAIATLKHVASYFLVAKAMQTKFTVKRCSPHAIWEADKIFIINARRACAGALL